MRLLHTSDWHLGRTLHGASLLSHQRDFLAWLLATAVAERVDAVLVAGDVYDRAVPTTDAVAMLDETLAGFVAAGIPIMLSSGNHDSAIRLGFGARVTEAAGVHLRTRLDELTRPMILQDAHGEVAVYGIPYLLPDAVMAELGAERSHESVLRAATERIAADAAVRGITRVVALAHAFVTGGMVSDSERDISVGGIGDAPASVFDGLTYVALGHLHGQQQVAAHARYSGSPLAFSFSERNHCKSVTVVDLDEAGLTTTLIGVPVARPLREVRGRLDELLGLDDPSLADSWIKAVITDPRRPLAPMERLRERWPHTLILEFAPDVAESVERQPEPVRPSESTDPIEMCAGFVEWVDSTLPDRAHLDTLRNVVETVRRAELLA